MTPFKRPMLAASLLPSNVEHTDAIVFNAMEQLKYPVCATLKMDGIRAIRTEQGLVSRTLKLIPNKSLQQRAALIPRGMDMELWNNSLYFNEVESRVMSFEHPLENEIQFHILDNYLYDDGYMERQRQLIKCHYEEWFTRADCCFDLAYTLYTDNDLFNFEKIVMEREGEGICFRTPDSPYKQGRSTLLEQYLVKLSRFVRQEVQVIGFEEQLLNTNSTKRNAIGLMDRSSFQHKMMGKGTLGKFIVKNKDGLEFKVGIGVGLTDKLRLEIWRNQDKFIGRTMTIKHKPHGQLIKPRSPIMVGWREEGF